jgi:hypothetical protein
VVDGEKMLVCHSLFLSVSKVYIINVILVENGMSILFE